MTESGIFTANYDKIAFAKFYDLTPRPLKGQKWAQSVEKSRKRLFPLKSHKINKVNFKF